VNGAKRSSSTGAVKMKRLPSRLTS
jgi:hypothetical protein